MNRSIAHTLGALIGLSVGMTWSYVGSLFRRPVNSHLGLASIGAIIGAVTEGLVWRFR